MRPIELTDKEMEAVALIGAIPAMPVLKALETYFGTNKADETIIAYGELVRRISERNKEAAGK